jgi:DNA-binding LacI/PurR family transcriptional regulator
MPTVREIADLAGVSKSTVSLVLNEKPGVSEAMRERVLEAWHELQEREGAASSELPTRPRNADREPLSVLLLHPAILRSHQVFSEFLQGIQAGATLHGIQLRLAVNEPDLPSDHISHLYFSDPRLHPDGVLVIGARLDEPLPDKVRSLGIPIVLVGRQSTGLGVSAVGRDEEGIAFEATNHLLDLGHRAIAFVGGDLAYSYTHSRLQGYRRALEEQGIEPLERWMALGEGRKAAEKILATSHEITAAIFINDAFAMEGLPAFQAAGCRIPADLSIISFDDTEEARTFDPPLTSVWYPRYQEGLYAVKLLVNHIRQPLVKHCQFVFQASLIERASCAPPRQELDPRPGDSETFSDGSKKVARNVGKGGETRQDTATPTLVETVESKESATIP